jgi:hypothetical protein
MLCAIATPVDVQSIDILGDSLDHSFCGYYPLLQEKAYLLQGSVES